MARNMSSINTKMASTTATTTMSSPGTHVAPKDSARLANSSNNSANLSSDSRNPDIVSASAAVELKKPNSNFSKISLPNNINSFTPILRKISFLIATVMTGLAAPLCMIFGEKNPIRKLIEGLATQSVNLSLGWVAGITGILDQLRRKDLPMVLIQLGDSLATLLSPLANKTMNRGVWIGGMNIANFFKKYIDEKPDFSSFGESITWTGTAAMRYLDELHSKGLKAIFTDHKSTAFGITTSMFTILGSVIYFITGDKNFAPVVRHAGGGFSEIQKFTGDNLESGRTQLVNAGVSMLGSSILDAAGKFVSQFNPSLGQAMNYGSQALNNFGRGNQLESQRINELGHSYKPVSFTGALGKGLKDFFDIGSLFNYFNKEPIPVMELKPHANTLQAAIPGQVASATARPKSGFHTSNGFYGSNYNRSSYSSGFGRTSARPVTANTGSNLETQTSSTPTAKITGNNHNFTDPSSPRIASEYIKSQSGQSEAAGWRNSAFAGEKRAASAGSGSTEALSNNMRAEGFGIGRSPGEGLSVESSNTSPVAPSSQSSSQTTHNIVPSNSSPTPSVPA